MMSGVAETRSPGAARRAHPRCFTPEWLLTIFTASFIVSVAIGGAALAIDDARPAMPSALAAKTLLLDAARAGDRVVAVGAYGHVLLSDDDGLTWRQATSVPTRATLTGVTFVGEREGWAVGHDAVILATTDGGEHWTLQHRDTGADGPLFSIWLDGAGRGLAVGAYGQALSTDDGGVTWRPTRVGGPEEDWHLNELFEATGEALYVAAEGGRVYRSVDGGRSWEPRPSAYAGSFWGGLVLSDGRMMVFGMRGHAFSSDDGGASWEALPQVSRSSLAAAAELDGGEVIVAGLAGSLLMSRDGARSFVAMTRPERQGANAVLPLASGGGVLLFGEGGVSRLSSADLRALETATSNEGVEQP